MLLAGGVVAVAACSSSSQGTTGVNFCCNGNGDPCCRYQSCGAPLDDACRAELACQADGGTYDPSGGNGCTFFSEAGPDSAADAGTDVVIGPFCCNANGDPCCRYESCGAPLDDACRAELACKADGGTFNPYQYTEPDGSIVNAGCSLSSEAGSDAAPDSEPPDAGGG